ncbi:hypothetical protein EYC59_03005 [Candidatus Saccharibacteria bacterium]|nr:MAG: hypothetical protein EYC59_03005 [Candidatus Saccharibacteria bacterium]
MTVKANKSVQSIWGKVRYSVAELPRHTFATVAGIFVFAAIGTVLLVSSHAATPTTNFEAEAGTRSGNTTVITDSGASGASGVKFNAAVSGTRTCPAYPAMPDSSCTGVPAGTTLTTVNGDMATSSSGQVINAKLITGDLIIGDSNITVTNTRIMGRIVNNASNGLVVRDSDIGADSCPANASNYNNLNGTNYQLIRSHVHNSGADLIGIGGQGTILIQDSIIDQACYYPGDHLDVAQWYAPGALGHVTIAHTIMDAEPGNVATSEHGNAAIIWADGAASGSTLTAYNNRFKGGNYTLMLYDATAGSGVVFDVHDNTFIKNTYTYGACNKANSIMFDGTSGLKFTNNKFDDGTALSC